MDRFDDEVRKNYRWNVTVSWTDGILFSIGLAFCTDLTILPVFLSNFTDSKVIISLIPAITTLGLTLPQLLSAHYIESLPRKKPITTLIGVGMRLPWLFLALFALYLADGNNLLNIILFFVFYAMFTVTWGLILPPWLDIMGKIVPMPKRGFFMGVRFAIGRLAGIPAGFAAYYIIEQMHFPHNFALLFALSFVFMSVSLGFFAMTREPVHPTTRERRHFSEFMRAIPATIGHDRNFFWFIVFNMLVSSANLALGLYAVYGVKQFHLSDSVSGIFTAVLMVSQMVFSVAWGYWGDRHGYRGSLIASTLLCALAPLVALMAPSIEWYYLVFILIGGFISANQVVNMNIILEFSAPEDRPLYISASYALTAPVFSLSPIIGGLFADLVSWQALFLAAFIFPMLALAVVIMKVKDPRLTTKLDAAVRD